MTALAAFALPVAAHPAQTEGDAFEILSIALELGNACKAYTGFEYHYLVESWNANRKDSAAQAAYGAARKAAQDRGFDALNVGIAGNDAMTRQAAAYRDKAAKLGCEGGQLYVDLGRVEAYKQLGGLAALIIGMRGKADASSPLPPLTATEAGLLKAFRTAAADAFGDNMPQFEELTGQLAQQRLARYPANPELGFAHFIDEQSAAFALLHHEALVTSAGWTARGAILSDGSPFGYHSMSASKNGAPDLSLFAAPRAVTINSNAWGNPVTGYIALGRRADSTMIAGLAGGTIHGAPDTLTVKVRATGTAMLTLAGTRVTDNCPYARCFAFTGTQMNDLLRSAGTKPVYVFAAADANAAPDGTGTDGQDVPVERMRALFPSR